MIYSLNKYWLLSFLSFFCCYTSQAQVIPDNTLPENSTVDSDCANTCQVDGGTTKGDNLFHSFEQFSVPTKGEVTFKNNPQIENIFTRVTGSSISDIDGVIRAQGSANFFLINPNGIIFGNNAQLDVGGSFLATTTESIFFADDSQFSATNPQASSLLTVSVPIGLQFGETPGAIVNKSQATEIDDLNFTGIPIPPVPIPIGLKVDNGKTIALVGNGVTIDGGLLTAKEGRIELGSVGANSYVDLTQNANSLILNYDSVSQFSNIFFLNFNQHNNNINNSNSVEESKGSVGFSISSSYEPEKTSSPSGVAQIYGDLVEFDNVRIDSLNGSAKEGGRLTIVAKTLNLRDSTISLTTSSEGKAGDIKINANLINLIRENEESGFFAQTQDSSGKAGDIEINTNRLFLQGGAQISVTTFGSGKGGNLTVNASDSIEVIGRTLDGKFPSALFAQSQGGKATGDAGNLSINTRSLVVRDGGKVSVGANESSREDRRGISQGNGGNLTINATESIEVSGFGKDEAGKVFPSTLLSESQGSGDAGNLQVTTPELTVADGGEINVSATGTGEAGSLNIQARNLTLDRGTLIATTKSGDQGNITLSNIDTLLMRNGSQINTNATKKATGGNITIQSNAVGLLDESKITANADEGKGGNIFIKTQGLIREPNTEIEASSDEGIDGTVTIYSPDVDPASGIIELTDIPIDVDAILTRNLCRLEKEKIAQGSSLIITGRGGLTPTAEDSLDNVENVVRWTNPQSVEVSQDGLVGLSQRSLPKEASQAKDLMVQQSQGWVTTADGSVWLVANSPELIQQNSQISPNNCQVFQ